MNNSVYQIITDRITQMLESGTVPWQKPWSGEAYAPRNLVSGRRYRGINAFLLACSLYESPFWLTFKQATQLGGTVRKGERSNPVVFWKWLDVEDAEPGEKKVPLLRYYRVFHVTQCDLPKGKVPDLPEAKTFDFTPIEACEQVVRGMPAPPAVNHGTHSAFYRETDDAVHMPEPDRFEKPEYYYSTLFHELTHATGHAKRLSREGITDTAPFGTATYSREELVAEFGAAFLCGHCGIEKPVIENSAAYIQGWLKELRSDARLVVHAAAAAQKAADFILGVTHTDDS